MLNLRFSRYGVSQQWNRASDCSKPTVYARRTRFGCREVGVITDTWCARHLVTTIFFWSRCSATNFCPSIFKLFYFSTYCYLSRMVRVTSRSHSERRGRNFGPIDAGVTWCTLTNDVPPSYNSYHQKVISRSRWRKLSSIPFHLSPPSYMISPFQRLPTMNFSSKLSLPEVMSKVSMPFIANIYSDACLFW